MSNLLVNFVTHERASRRERVARLVRKMMKTLPNGSIAVEAGNLMNLAAVVEADTK